MHVTYGRERSKAARRATADIVSNSAQRGWTKVATSPLTAYIITADGKELYAIVLTKSAGVPDVFISSQHRARDLTRITHKLHRLSNITSAATAPVAPVNGPSMPQEWSFVSIWLSDYHCLD
jgi:hypothetical protein